MGAGLRAKAGLGAALSVALICGGAVTANAAVLPDAGGTAGATSVQIPADRVLTFTQVSAGDEHTVAVGSDGNAYAWGLNSSGQLGDGTTTDSSSAVRVQAPAGVTFTQVAAGDSYTVAVGSDGNAYAWGSNASGQLGDGTTTDSSSAVRVQAPSGVTFTQVAACTYHAIAVGSDGNTYAWGNNGDGQLGNGTTSHPMPVPVLVQAPAGVTFTQVAAGGAHTVAVGSDGNAYAWGWNRYGQLGDGTTTDSSVPVAVDAPAGVRLTRVASGTYHTVAVGSDGNAYVWGSNVYGEGDGTTTSSPMQVHAPAGVTFTQVAAGYDHTVAVGSDGNIYAWGDNGEGELGDGTATSSRVPVRVHAPDGVTLTQVAAGDYHTVASDSDGKTYAWGRNDHGQLGDGTTTDSPTPVPVSVPVLSVESVTFGGTAGTITGRADGMVTVTTPEHAAGAVDVVLTWSDGVKQTLRDGYTFGAAPKVTLDPVSGKIPDGKAVVLTAAATGDETPTVQWQVSADDGHTWSDVSGATETSLSVKVAGRYRAVFRNALDTATTSAAALTTAVVAPPASTPPATSTPPASAPATSTPSGLSTPPATSTSSEAPASQAAGRLVRTGADVAPFVLVGLLLLLLGGGLLSYRTVRSRNNRL